MRLTGYLLGTGLVCIGFVQSAFTQTDGAALFEGTVRDYNGSSTKHWTVGWVTKEDGTFIKSLRKQGPSWTATHWDSHCKVWNTARGGSAAGSQALDGYSSATAPDYSGTNSPVIWSWNCRDVGGNLVPDGKYKFWLQYAEDSGQGAHTTNGLTWVKGPTIATTTYPNIAANFANLKVTWTPNLPPALVLGSVRREGDNLILQGTGPANSPFSVLASPDVTRPISEWVAIGSGTSDAPGKFNHTNVFDAGVTQWFYRLRLP